MFSVEMGVFFSSWSLSSVARGLFSVSVNLRLETGVLGVAVFGVFGVLGVRDLPGVPVPLLMAKLHSAPFDLTIWRILARRSVMARGVGFSFGSVPAGLC